MRDLPPTGGDPCAKALVINARGQVVGADTNCAGQNLNAMLWENGSAFNLNSMVGTTELHLSEAFFISARGEIGCLGTLPNGDTRVAVLIPVAPGARGADARASGTRTVAAATRDH